MGKKLFIIFSCLFFTCSQGQTVYKYYLNLSNYTSAHSFIRVNGKMVYSGSNTTEASFFNNYSILEYYQAFPNAIDPYVLNIFYLETNSNKLAGDLKSNYPSLYLNSEDLTNRVIESLVDYYPNDYGTTTQNSGGNLGVNVSRKELDYLRVPQTWGDFTKGSPSIKVGISDTAIRTTADDFINKIETITGYVPNTTGYSHGNGVAELAAGRGDNASGSVGVCMDCNIVAGNMGIGFPTVMSNLYKMAMLGAKVINMSWCSPCYTNNANGGSPNDQAVINDLVNNYKVTLVAAAGNATSFSSPSSYLSTSLNGVLTGNPISPFGIVYVFPASYDNVISVSTVNHKNPYTLPLGNSVSPSNPTYCCQNPTTGNHLHGELEDSVAKVIQANDPNNPVGLIGSGYYLDQYNPTGLSWLHTLNNKVDLLSTGYSLFSYGNHLAPNQQPPLPLFETGTSFSAPIVTGTIGLMLSVNNCLIPNEIENILKLTTKDIEYTSTLNSNFAGLMGAGKLEVYNSVEFVNEMKKVDGNAIIKNHTFTRFNFKLVNINNNLTIQNVTFRDNNTSDFVAKKQIVVKSNSLFKPNASGSIHLGINPNIVVTCSAAKYANENENSNIEKEKSNLVLYPNPNNGVFELSLNNITEFKNKEVLITVLDINGRVIFEKDVVTDNNDLFNVSLTINSLTQGVYFVKVSVPNYFETVKFIKN